MINPGYCPLCGRYRNLVASDVQQNLASDPYLVCVRCHDLSIEHSWVIVGTRQGRLWLGKRQERWTGEAHQVQFDAEWVQRRHLERDDVLGWYHTHPLGCAAYVSDRDLATMRAWFGCLGKPQLCLIKGSQGLRGWVFEHDESEGDPLRFVQLVGNITVGVGYGGKHTVSP